MKTVLVDDELAARGMLRDLLKEVDDVEVIGEAANGVEAIHVIEACRPDLVFLDVQMPVLSGFDLLPYLKHKPMIVFCSAFDAYAVQAFEERALDYLVKPVEPERLAICLERVRNEREKLATYSRYQNLGKTLKKVICSVGDAHRVVWLEEIVAFFKDGRYTAVRTENGHAFLTDLTLDYLGERIHNPRFFRVSRGAILRRDYITGYRVKATGAGEIETRDKQVFSLSKGRVKQYKTWLEEHTFC